MGRNQIAIPVLGQDTSGPATLLDPRATPDCQAVRVSYNHIKKREGYDNLGTSAGVYIWAFYEFIRESTRYFVRITTTGIQLWNNMTAQWTDLTGTVPLVGTDKLPVSVCATDFAGKAGLVFTNYVDNIKKWIPTGNIADLGGSPPKARFLCPYGGYLLAAGIKEIGVEYPQKIQWPDTDDPEYWTQDDTHNAGEHVLADDGEAITGIAKLETIVCVSKASSLYNGYLTGNSAVFGFDKKDTSLGFLVHNTIKSIPGGRLIGLGKSGLVTYNAIRGEIIGRGIVDDLRRLINPAYLFRSFGVVMEELDEYLLFIPTGNQTHPGVVIRYNYQTDQIYKDVCSNMTAAGLRTEFEGITWNMLSSAWNVQTGRWNDIIQKSFFPVMILGNKDGQCFKFNYTRFDEAGTAVDGYWCTKDFQFYPGYYFHLAGIGLEIAGTTVEVDYSLDEGVTWTAIETVAINAVNPVFKSIPCDIFGEKVRFRIRNRAVDGWFSLRNFYYDTPVQREQVV
jgi:hypothetical protein